MQRGRDPACAQCLAGCRRGGHLREQRRTEARARVKARGRGGARPLQSTCAGSCLGAAPPADEVAMVAPSRGAAPALERVVWIGEQDWML